MHVDNSGKEMYVLQKAPLIEHFTSMQCISQIGMLPTCYWPQQFLRPYLCFSVRRMSWLRGVRVEKKD